MRRCAVVCVPVRRAGAMEGIEPAGAPMEDVNHIAPNRTATRKAVDSCKHGVACVHEVDAQGGVSRMAGRDSIQ